VKDWYTVESFRIRELMDGEGKQYEYKDHKNLRWWIEKDEEFREESKEKLAWQAWGARNIDEKTSPDPYKVQVWGQEPEYKSEEYLRKRYRRTGNWVCEKVMEGYSKEMWEEEEGGRLKAQKGYDVKKEAEVRVAGEGIGRESGRLLMWRLLMGFRLVAICRHSIPKVDRRTTCGRLRSGRRMLECMLLSGYCTMPHIKLAMG